MWILEESCYEVSSCCFLKQLTINTKRYMILLPYLYHISILCCILCISNNNWKNILCISWKVEGKWSYKLSSWLGLGKEPGQPGARPGTASFKMSLGSIELGHDQLSMTHSAQPIKRANLVLKIKFILCMFNNRVTIWFMILQDKWKTLVHTARISPQQRRGEPVPQELLDRVLLVHAYWSQQQARQQMKHHSETRLLLSDGCKG